MPPTWHSVPIWGSYLLGGMMPRARTLMLPSANDKSFPASFDPCFMAVLRCVLATAILLVIVLDPVARLRVSGVTYLILSFYLIYSILPSTAPRWWHLLVPATVEAWIDVGWAIGLPLLNRNPSGSFAGFLVVAMLITACPRQLAAGVRLALVVGVLFLSMGMAR